MLLNMKRKVSIKQATVALIITPSKELCLQTANTLNELLRFCQREISVVDISKDVPFEVQKQMLASNQDIIVSTPSKILNHLKAHNINLKESLELLVIDEADLLLSFGYEEEMKTLVDFLSKKNQTILLSATLNDDVNSVKSLYLHNPAILKLKETELTTPTQLEQFEISCNNEEDKFVLLYSMMKLNLIRGKSIIFVNSVNRCYKLKLFLEQFGLRSCVLNSELPINSRMHIIEQFNGGLYESIIASDENEIGKKASVADQTKKTKSKMSDSESNIARGIDFKNVQNVINFDFPQSTKSYVHRIGRTARANMRGTALSFVDPSEIELFKQVENDLAKNESTEHLLSQDTANNMPHSIFKTFKFKMDEIEGFRYRSRDVLRSITNILIKETRIKEIKNEILNSEKLKSYFDENPREANILRHDKEVNTTKLQEHLKHVPDYIIPISLRGLPMRSESNHKSRKTKTKNFKKRLSQTQTKYKKTLSDPLKSFKFKNKTL